MALVNLCPRRSRPVINDSDANVSKERPAKEYGCGACKVGKSGDARGLGCVKRRKEGGRRGQVCSERQL